ncbi:MAG: hypothetical protein EWV49_08580 [Microcystis aeruginosa Ma_QC_Ch_20071001_S25]|uniref:Uncharacterized protein n=1 Tax=Microcystis aeruginosa Ma_QC_Ch_20071001_S25D TaxID=2486250 RepID=A0A552FZR0_MICAE|nr:MAG: hypothetical protein EWV49_08580 [Microcystis aeruginosa Ma_QC_Ch_20071001_S25]TRU52220.1 MAG: hypothetical protein EWV57_05880 [Microcystis aeruginosa Ma_QC_Ch_20071001_S25D]TRU56931.1 MAG: hypothetical protein EWV90_21740 [Microcystis aeruginosa Ma_QC_Ch_20071001_M135]
MVVGCWGNKIVFYPYPLSPNPYPPSPIPHPLIPIPYPLIPIPHPLIPIPYLLTDNANQSDNFQSQD